MAKNTKKAARAAEKVAKKYPKLFTALVIILVIVLIAAACWYFLDYKKAHPNGPNDLGGTNGGNGGNGGETTVLTGDLAEIASADLSVHFLELGNKYTGDCTLIKAGDTEVLIDAGSRQNSAEAIVNYVSQYCTDGVIEYCIATHAHQDHIAGFVGTTSAPGVFESFSFGTIIDFPLTNATSNIYERYIEERDKAVEAGATHYTALQCWNETDGAKREYELAEGVTMRILYQRFYEEETSDENDYSVCMLLSQGEENFLFTGDLEADGEQSLVDHNELPHCKLFKGGHHGSYTASTEALLSVIQPEIVCVCCCAGSPEYTVTNENMFPSQAFIDRVGVYTDKIYVTTLATDVVAIPKDQSETGKEEKSWEYTSMNGNIVLYLLRENGEAALKLWCSNNTTILKDTEWFRENRTWSGV